jgi:glycosyltransferase involved in cell wall biosynthesis
MDKITFVLPSRNNLEFLQLAYKSLRNLDTKHEILVLDDASTDNTQEWIKSLNDEDLITYHNPGPERIGIVGMFDKGIEMARTEIIFAFHADMIAGKDLDKNILKHLKPGVVVSATRVEPPLHPPGVEKITVDFGIEAEQFNFDKWYTESELLKRDITTEGIFAPWCMYKLDYLAIGGHDDLFAPQSKEDSDLFNRFVLNGYQVLQSWNSLVYHFTSRGSRFNKHAGGAAGKNSDEWLYTTNKNAKNFIRKWGHFVQHDEYMKPIIPHKYNIHAVIENCSLPILEAIEPWFKNVFLKTNSLDVIFNYIQKEQLNTQFDLIKRVKIFDEKEFNMDGIDILVEFDARKFTQNSFNIIQNLSDIITQTNDLGEFDIDCFRITITNLRTYENELISI